MFERLINRFVSWLYKLLEAERNRVTAEELRAKLAELEAQARANAAAHLRDLQLRQSRCFHMKGGRGPKPFHKDYAITDHTFADQSRQVRCQICGKKWSKAEGNWSEAEAMMNSTSNTPTSSEVSFKIEDREKPQEVRLTEKEKQEWLNPAYEPFAPYISISLWRKLMKRFDRLKKRKK